MAMARLYAATPAPSVPAAAFAARRIIEDRDRVLRHGLIKLLESARRYRGSPERPTWHTPAAAPAARYLRPRRAAPWPRSIDVAGGDCRHGFESDTRRQHMPVLNESFSVPDGSASWAAINDLNKLIPCVP